MVVSAAHQIMVQIVTAPFADVHIAFQNLGIGAKDWSNHNSSRFPQEFELAKVRQDRQLEGIERGLGTLREVGLAMGEALDHQDVLVDAITEKARVHQRSHILASQTLPVTDVVILALVSMPSCLLLLHVARYQQGLCTCRMWCLLLHAGGCVLTLQVDDVTKQLKTNNMKLKGLVTQVSACALELPHGLRFMLTLVSICYTTS